MTHRIFLLVKNTLFCEGLYALLGKEKDFSLVGSARNCDKAIQDLKGLKPQVLILDSLLLRGESHEFIRYFQSYMPDLPILATF